MASPLISNRDFVLRPPCIQPRRPSSSTLMTPPFSTYCSPAQRGPYPLRSRYRNSRSSYQDLPELAEDSKFTPLNSDDPKYGPPAVLLLGFQVEEAVVIQKLLKELDGEFLQVIFCTEDMIGRTLWEAVNTKQTALEASQVTASLPRICFLSGLSGEEMMMFIDAFPETGLESPVFAAMVPNSADKTIAVLTEEIMGDHEMMVARQATQQA